MSLFLHSSVPLLSFTKLPATARTCFSHKINGSESPSPRTIQCMAAKRNSENSNIIRRTAFAGQRDSGSRVQYARPTNNTVFHVKGSQ